jgi:hypothetical protein
MADTAAQRRIINTYDQLKAAGGGVAITVATSGGRDTYVSGWYVTRVNEKGELTDTDPGCQQWYHHKSKHFSCALPREQPFHVRRQLAFEQAAAWVHKTYGEAGPWQRNRQGDFLPQRIARKFPLEKRR